MSPQFCIHCFKYQFQWHCSMCLYPFFHCFYLTAKFLLAGLYPTTEKLSLSVHSAIKCETKKVKGIWFSLSSCFSVVPGKPPEFQYLRLFSCQFQSVFCKAFFQPLLKYFCFILVLKTTDKIINTLLYTVSSRLHQTSYPIHNADIYLQVSGLLHFLMTR